MSEIIQSEPCILASNLSQMDASMITALLEDSGIPSFIKDRGTGGYMRIYMGYTIYGQDLFVGQDNYDKAKELMDFYFSTDNEAMEMEQEDFIEEDENTEFDEDSVNLNRLRASTVARILIFLFVLVTIAAILLNRFY